MGLLKSASNERRRIVIRKGRVKADRRQRAAVSAITSRAPGASGLNGELTPTRSLPPLIPSVSLSLAQDVKVRDLLRQFLH